MTKQGVKRKYQRILNEKYEMYLNSMRRMINTNAHKTKSTNYNKVHVIQGLSKRFEQFKFGLFYLLIVKIRYNFTHK